MSILWTRMGFRIAYILLRRNRNLISFKSTRLTEDTSHEFIWSQELEKLKSVGRMESLICYPKIYLYLPETTYTYPVSRIKFVVLVVVV